MLTNRSRKALTVCSSLAIATALAAGPQAAHAQSFQGSSTVVAGSATVTTGSNTTTVDIASPQAVINWSPFDTGVSAGVPINFQPAGTTATFQGTSDFAVLNRILPNDPSRPIAFNGTVTSQLQGAATTPGGTVYFYSPGGILVGSSAVFNVGNLGLTALDPVIDGNGNWYNGNQVQFQQGNPGSMVNIQAGAQLTASPANSYIALVAPSVQNYGAINVNGSAALVAAEAATITFSPDGLFDIQVTVGTSAQTFQGTSGNTALYNSGTITGPAGTAGSDNHRIYLVAVPKNQLLANVIVAPGSTLGFDVASAADVVGNAVVLSAGYDIARGAIAGPSAAGSGRGVIEITNSASTSAVSAKATDRLFAAAQSGNLLFASDANLAARNTAAVLASGSGLVTVGGNLTLSADGDTPVAGAQGDAGLAIFDLITGSSANIAGNLTVSANAFGDLDGNGTATGGTAQVSLSNSALSVGGNAILRAQGITDFLSTSTAAAGGRASLLVNDAGTMQVGGVTRLRSEGVSGRGANATGGTSFLGVFTGSALATNELNVSADADGLAGGPSASPGSTTGGTAVINVSDPNSSLTVSAGNSTGDFNIGELDLLSAEAFAGASNAAGGGGGTAQGGRAQLIVSDGAVANLPTNPGSVGFVRMVARAYGGNTFATGGTGGAAMGGTVDLFVSGGTLNAGNTLLPSSFAQGGSADISVTGAANGGNAVGGFRNITVANGTINGSFSGGGPGAQGGNGSLLGTGGNGTGGTANLFMDNGTISATSDAFGISRMTVFTQNAGGGGAIGGIASGGAVNVTLQNYSLILMMPDANGVGGMVAFNSFNFTPDQTAAGAISTGDATAGSVNVSIRNSQIDAAEFDVYANAASGLMLTPGAGANAHTGNATGGFAIVNLDGATINAGLSVSAVGEAGYADDPSTVDAGNGAGGTALLFAAGAPSTVTGDVEVDASGTGGTVFGGPGNGGSATGGRALLQANNGGTLTVNGSAYVNAGADGHSAQVLGRGGDAKAGFAEVSAVGGGTLILNGELELTSSAESGDGTVAGVASALFQPTQNDFLPNAILYAQNGSIRVSGQTYISSHSFGGSGFAGGAGGAATAGSAVVNSDNSLAGASSISLQDLVVYASAYGGDGGSGVSGGTGGAGGAATGGEADAFAGAGNGHLTVAGQTQIIADAVGGTGGDGGSGATGGPGGAGGLATGGLTLFGSLSRGDTGAVNTGAASFTDVLAFADASGGTGGAGGVGSSTTGNGGAGGAAFDGAAILAVRGSQVTITGQANLNANAFGGDGGAGAVQGVGGAATVGGNGGVAVQSFARFQQPTQRGFLDAGDIFGAAQAFGGAGSATGASLFGDSPVSINITDSDVTANSLVLFASADQPATSALPSFMTIARSTLDIAGTLAMITPGDLSISLDTSTVNVNELSLSAGNFVLPAIKPATLGTFNVSGPFDVSSGLDFLAYANFVLAGGGTFDADGSILTGNIASDGPLNLSAVGSITTGAIDAAFVGLQAGQAVTTAAITSDGGIFIDAGGAVAVGDLTAGGTTPGAGKIAIGSTSGPVTTGAVRSTGDLGIQTGGSITTGNLIGRDVLLLSGESLSTGSILAASGTQATGGIYFGNFSMATSTSNVFEQFRGQTALLPIFQATPAAIGGSATFGGPIQGGSLTGAAQGALSAQAVSAANFIHLQTGGLATVGGAWRAPDIELVSNDVTIGQAGSLDALSANGAITLASTNATGMVVGDVQGATGYVLDNAEFGRIKAGEIDVIGTDGTQATDMTIGTLAISGNQLYGPDGAVLFATGNLATETPGGVVRIAGAVTATGFAPTTEIDLAAGTVEIDAVNGSLKVSDGSNGLGGLVFIEADHIHVASDAILAKLRADPLYDGHITDINTPLAVARRDGVLNALGLELYPGQTLYVQNTGTVGTPAGFLTRLDNTDLVAPDVPPTGGVEVVINGQFQTDTGTLTGREASDLVQADNEGGITAFAGFSSTSQINGCLFVGGNCSSAVDPVAAISSQISNVANAMLDDSPVAPAADDADEGDESSDDKDEDDNGDTGSSPIAPPAPLINTRPLNPNANVEQPVAGAGNPALLGSVVNEQAPEGDDQ